MGLETPEDGINWYDECRKDLPEGAAPDFERLPKDLPWVQRLQAMHGERKLVDPKGYGLSEIAMSLNGRAHEGSDYSDPDSGPSYLTNDGRVIPHSQARSATN